MTEYISYPVNQKDLQMKNLLSQNKKENGCKDYSIHNNPNLLCTSHKNNLFRQFFCCFPKRKKGPLIDLDDPLLQNETIVEI